MADSYLFFASITKEKWHSYINIIVLLTCNTYCIFIFHFLEMFARLFCLRGLDILSQVQSDTHRYLIWYYCNIRNLKLHSTFFIRILPISESIIFVVFDIFFLVLSGVFVADIPLISVKTLLNFSQLILCQI